MTAERGAQRVRIRRPALPAPAGIPGRDDEIDCAAAALRADEARGPFSYWQTGAVVRGLLAGIDVDAVLAIPAPCPQQQNSLLPWCRASPISRRFRIFCAAPAIRTAGRGADQSVRRVIRVEMWRGGGRLGISVSAPFVWRCLTGAALAPFPHPAHRTGRADFPHPALGQGLTPSPTARCARARPGVPGRYGRSCESG